jgi:hypothetical protein
VAPWVVVASLPFAPEIVIPTIRRCCQLALGMTRLYGFKPSFNQTFTMDDSPTGWWMSPYHFGIDQGPVALMIETTERVSYGISCADAHATAVQSRTYWSQCRELWLLAITHNVMILYGCTGFLQSRDESFTQTE